MTRRTLDIIFAAGGLVIAVLILVLGLVLQNQANFAKDYVHDQLAQQKITFTPAQRLDAERERSVPEEQRRASRSSPASRPQCYANHYIAVHLERGQRRQDLRRDEQRGAGAARPEQRRGQGAERQGRRRCSGARPCAVCCSRATASASSATERRPPRTSVTRSRSCCSSPRSPASSTPPPSRPSTRSSPLPPTSQHKHRR